MQILEAVLESCFLWNLEILCCCRDFLHEKTKCNPKVFLCSLLCRLDKITYHNGGKYECVFETDPPLQKSIEVKSKCFILPSFSHMDQVIVFKHNNTWKMRRCGGCFHWKCCRMPLVSTDNLKHNYKSLPIIIRNKSSFNQTSVVFLFTTLVWLKELSF